MRKRKYTKRDKAYWGLVKPATKKLEEVTTGLKELICEDQEKTSCHNAEFCKFFTRRYNK